MLDPSRPSFQETAGIGKPLTGGFSVIRVISNSGGGFWAAERNGQRITVASATDLMPGTVYRGILRRSAGRWVFTPRESWGDLPGRNAPGIGPINVPLPGTQDHARLLIVRAFLRAALPFPEGEKLAEFSRIAGRSSSRETLKRSALIARCAGRGLQLSEDDFETLYSLLEGSYGRPDSGDSRERERKKGKESRDPADEVPENDSPSLYLFNHLLEREDSTWFIIPYRCDMENLVYNGSLRLFYKTREKRAETAVLSVRGEKSGELWYFRWPAGGKGLLRVYHGDGRGTRQEIPGPWMRKFRKMGLYIDDIIHKDDSFDGFDEAGEGPDMIDETV